ncbi:MAG: amino acid decarboxylase [Clostridiales bacterium]|nr:amino acid decarboxylase [Clostridiales bacterium]
MNSSPIYHAIKAHKAKKRAAFQMPGHKGWAQALSPLAGVLEFDLTEIPDTGSLFDGEGPTSRAEELATALFESQGSFMSAGGCTLCINAMLRLALPQGGKLVCGRVIHRCVINTMALLGIEPIWVLPDDSAGQFFAGRIRPRDVERALEENPDAKAVFLTSPDYFGTMSDIRGISKITDKYKLPLLVDNAHGAHLYFLEGNPSPLAQGATMSADSAHKTLPVLTGGAWLNISDSSYLPKVREAMALFASTSPSYPIMLSLDLCRLWLADRGKEDLKKTADKVMKLKEEIEKLGLIMPQGKVDPMRLAFTCENLALKGREVGDLLRQEGVEPEYAGPEGIILIPTPFNSDDDFKTLYRALLKVSKLKLKKDLEKSEDNKSQEGLPRVVMTPSRAIRAQDERIATQGALGRVAATAVCPCPPAIPIVIPGELIGAREVKALIDQGYNDICVVK